MRHYASGKKCIVLASKCTKNCLVAGLHQYLLSGFIGGKKGRKKKGGKGRKEGAGGRERGGREREDRREQGVGKGKGRSSSQRFLKVGAYDCYCNDLLRHNNMQN